MNVVLCGMSGVGKTTVGMLVAKKTGRRFFDTDEMISKRYGDIPSIFEKQGEKAFRMLETEAARQICAEDGLVISTGGGLVLKRENVELLKKNGKIFFLRASAEALYARADATSRPLLKEAKDVREKIKSLLTARTPVYEAIADVKVDTDLKSPEEVAEEICALMEEL